MYIKKLSRNFHIKDAMQTNETSAKSLNKWEIMLIKSRNFKTIILLIFVSCLTSSRAIFSDFNTGSVAYCKETVCFTFEMTPQKIGRC